MQEQYRMSVICKFDRQHAKDQNFIVVMITYCHRQHRNQNMDTAMLKKYNETFYT